MQKIIEETLKKVREKSKPGDKIPVSKYADEESLRCFRPRENMTFNQHCQLVEATVVALREAGFDAAAVEINEREYRDWLSGDLNTEENRAKFVSLVFAKPGNQC